MFYSGYSPEQLNDIKNKTEGKSAFVYFNNTAGEEGILNALEQYDCFFYPVLYMAQA